MHSKDIKNVSYPFTDKELIFESYHNTINNKDDNIVNKKEISNRSKTISRLCAKNRLGENKS